MVQGDRMHQNGRERLLLPGESPLERNQSHQSHRGSFLLSNPLLRCQEGWFAHQALLPSCFWPQGATGETPGEDVRPT